MSRPNETMQVRHGLDSTDVLVQLYRVRDGVDVTAELYCGSFSRNVVVIRIPDEPVRAVIYAAVLDRPIVRDIRPPDRAPSGLGPRLAALWHRSRRRG